MRGKEFREWHKQAGISQQNVAGIVGVNRSTVSQIETNDLPVAPEWCEKIVEFLNERARDAEREAK